MIVLQEQQFFAAREVAKVDARPGGYVATGGHGGILGGMGYHGAAVLHYLPGAQTYLPVGGESSTKIPSSVKIGSPPVARSRLWKQKSGKRTAIFWKARSRRWLIVKDGGFFAEEYLR